MQPENQPKDLFRGALILTVGALLTKILSAIYRIPFQNIVGDVGLYIYQQVYPFYGLALVLSTYGYPVIISKLYAERASKNDSKGINRLFITTAFFLTILGIIAFFTLYSGANWLAYQMNDPNLAVLLRIISFVFLLFPIISLLRGYNQGRGDMVPTAVSQVLEQAIRVITILVAATVLTHQGFSLYIVGGGAVFGSVTGGFVCVLVLLAFFLYRNRRLSPVDLIRDFDFTETKGIVKALLIQGFAICISSMLLIFIQLADSLNLYSLLLERGLNEEDAKVLKGIYDRGHPLIQLGTVVATSMSLSLVPLITSEKLKAHDKALLEKIRLALRISLLFGVGATVGLWGIIKPTNLMLFENMEGSHVLSYLSVLILLSSVIMTVTALLQGLGYTLFPAGVILLGFGIKFLLNGLLIPSLGTSGAAIASSCTLMIILLILSIKLKYVVRASIFQKRSILLISGAAITMHFILKIFLNGTDFLYNFGSDRLMAAFQAISAVAIGGLSFVFIVLKFKGFKEEELALLPFGSKLIWLLPKNRR